MVRNYLNIKYKFFGNDIKSTHNAGFFSCCSIKLESIINFLNKKKKLPDSIDSSKQFKWYKNDDEQDKDITFHYFDHYNNISVTNITPNINYHHDKQYDNYQKLDYKAITPLIKKYFSPSVEINEIIKDIEKKYNLSYENICVLFYRGNDKRTEIKNSGYNEYLKYANKILEKNTNIIFLIQSDETEFIEFMTIKFPNNSFYFKNEIRHINKSLTTVDKVMKSKNYEFSKKFLAITIIMSRCKYVICGSGNCDMWIMFYRGNSENVIQNLKDKWFKSF